MTLIFFLVFVSKDGVGCESLLYTNVIINAIVLFGILDGIVCIIYNQEN